MTAPDRAAVEAISVMTDLVDSRVLGPTRTEHLRVVLTLLTDNRVMWLAERNEELRDQVERQKAELERLGQVEQDDTRAVNRLLREVRIYPSIAAMKTMTRVEERFADRIAADLAARDEREPEPCDGDCDCDCQPGQPCLCPERDCYCGPCRVCDRDENDGTGQ